MNSKTVSKTLFAFCAQENKNTNRFEQFTAKDFHLHHVVKFHVAQICVLIQNLREIDLFEVLVEKCEALRFSFVEFYTCCCF